MKKLINFIKIPAKILLLGIFVAPLSYPAMATPSDNEQLTTYTREQISAKAIEYVENLFPAPEVGELTYEAVSLDKRIKIKPCGQPLRIQIPGKANLKKRTTVQMNCPGPKPWNLYVQVKIKRMMPMVVAKNNLAPGTLLSDNNISVIMKDASQIRGRTLNTPNTLYGARSSRYISAGQPVTLRQICLVCKGDAVTVIAKIKGLQVKTSGIAQQNGSLGDNIAILNRRSSKRIEARVVAVNRVEINI